MDSGLADSSGVVVPISKYVDRSASTSLAYDPTRMQAQVARQRAHGQVDVRWKRWAACRKPELGRFFFPGPNGNYASKHLALATCAGCPVRKACLEYALEWGEDYGIWGGQTGSDLERLRKQRISAALAASTKEAAV